jgi:hypothetical protein
MYRQSPITTPSIIQPTSLEQTILTTSISRSGSGDEELQVRTTATSLRGIVLTSLSAISRSLWKRITQLSSSRSRMASISSSWNSSIQVFHKRESAHGSIPTRT